MKGDDSTTVGEALYVSLATAFVIAFTVWLVADYPAIVAFAWIAVLPMWVVAYRGAIK